MGFYASRPLVFGHRGAREAAPENTLAAFQAALQMGADGIELDVMLSADQVPVVIHDSAVDRTTNGSGLVSEHPLAELQALDAGSWFSAQFAEERIPTLEEIFQALGRRTRINVELKTEAIRNEGLESRVVQLIQQYGLASHVVFSSFSPLALWRARRLAPEIGRGLLYSASLPLPLRQGWAIPFLGLQAVHPHHGMVDGAYMAWARRRGFRVNAWTVNEPSEMERLLDLGVDMLITDCPDLALEIVKQRYEAQ